MENVDIDDYLFEEYRELQRFEDEEKIYNNESNFISDEFFNEWREWKWK